MILWFPFSFPFMLFFLALLFVIVIHGLIHNLLLLLILLLLEPASTFYPPYSYHFPTKCFIIYPTCKTLLLQIIDANHWRWSLTLIIVADHWCWSLMLIIDADHWCWSLMLIIDADHWCFTQSQLILITDIFQYLQREQQVFYSNNMLL